MARTKGRPYSRAELYGRGPRPPYVGRDLDEIAFPLGGLGTGCVSLGGWGQLRDWEIMNRPAKGFLVPYTFFTLRLERPGEAPLVRVLQGPAGGPYTANGHSSVPRETGAGLPHFKAASFRGEFPAAEVRFTDPEVPLGVTLRAFNPFIPLNEKESSIPVAILRYEFRNRTKRTLSFAVMGNLTNVIGGPEGEGRVNRARRATAARGLCLSTTALAENSPRYGSMVLATPWRDAFIWPRWKESRDSQLAEFWKAVARSGKLPARLDGGSDTGSVGARVTLRPGDAVTIPFIIAWHFPVCEHWDRASRTDGRSPATWRNYYGRQWDDAWEVAAYTARNLDRLWGETERFRQALFSSTLPTHVLDAVSSQLSVLKSPTCLRLEEGTFYGFEGCSDRAGCCEGSCTHVWNYAQALPYLFPGLQRSMREAEYENSLLDDGFMCFRMPLPLGTKGGRDFHPAADGQMGTVIQVYREWLISGDDEWLRRRWPGAKKALEFAWRYWDADRDGVMEGMQHNTYDIEFHGPNTMMGSLYLAALRAGEEMGRRLGDEASAAEYRRLFEGGARWSDEHLFNGEYYEQKVNPRAREAWPKRLRGLSEAHGRDDRFGWPKWQVGKGCLSDQLIGQWYAEMLGLGSLYDRRHVRRALRSIFRHNWRASLSDHPGLLRLYALDGEAGLLIATWPRGGRPGHPVVYADEVWCGIEYQVASHLIYEGFVEEGLSIVRGTRDRHTGNQRNPWDEFECGHHYVRSMASYSLLLALSGFSYSAAEARLGFSPKVYQRDFRTFFSVASGWGTYEQRVSGRGAEMVLRIESGSLRVAEIATSLAVPRDRTARARVGRRVLTAAVRRSRAGVALMFDGPVVVQAGETLRIRFS
ncbi:MAG TPA: GH116 family glycosyl-hydrolase [Armatimonadota bacterium]|nr:GH116 family glycosyl-hydrolase [Armatimonadota bacterium]